SSPRVIVQIAIAGAQILGKAFLAAGRQAVQNAKHRPAGGIGSDVAGVSNATSGSLTDKLTRDHRMTLDEAQLILNVKKGDSADSVMQRYEHLFKANSPPPAPAKPAAATSRGGKQPPSHAYSHYLQSKVVRARERIEAEMKLAEEPVAEAPQATPPPPSSAPPPEAGGKSS
ncbi:protein transporter, partial [Obba rivulosa]